MKDFDGGEVGFLITRQAHNLCRRMRRMLARLATLTWLRLMGAGSLAGREAGRICLWVGLTGGEFGRSEP